MNTDYYSILGVEKTASREEIKKAFRKLAHTHHPDKGGDEKKFKEINEAYQTLYDEGKRRNYDAFGANSSQSGGFGHAGFGGFDPRKAGYYSGARTGTQSGFGGFSSKTGSTQGFNLFSLRKISPIWWIILIPLAMAAIFIIGAFLLIGLLLRPFLRR